MLAPSSSLLSLLLFTLVQFNHIICIQSETLQLKHVVHVDPKNRLKSDIQFTATSQHKAYKINTKKQLLDNKRLTELKTSMAAGSSVLINQNKPNLPYAQEEVTEMLAPDMLDRETTISLATMSYDAYNDDESREWEELGENWDQREKFGFEEDGIRGYVFGSEDDSIIVISFKGTSGSFFGIGGGPTSKRDKKNDNMMFSCCCAKAGWTWTPICGCINPSSPFSLTRSHKRTCDFGCLSDAMDFEDSYYTLAQLITTTVSTIYPTSQLWFTGHSLGGALSSLMAMEFLAPAITFEAPGERLMAERVQLIPPRFFPMEGIDQKKWKKLIEASFQLLPIYHIGNDRDPIFTGKCNGFGTSCHFAGYAMESRCHVGKVCTFSSSSSNYWSITDNVANEIGTTNIAHHRLKYLIDAFLTNEQVDMPECAIEADCNDCESWDYVLN